MIIKGKTIKPQHLNKIFTDCDTQNLLNDFENNNIQNDLLNCWEVVYYFEVLIGIKKLVFTSKPNFHPFAF